MRGLCALTLVLLAVAPAVGAAPIEVVTTSTDLKSLVEVVGRDLVRVASFTKRMRDSGVKLVIGGVESNDAMMRLVAAPGGARPVTLISSVGGDPEARSYLALFDLNVKRLTAALAAR